LPNYWQSYEIFLFYLAVSAELFIFAVQLMTKTFINNKKYLNQNNG